MSSSEDVDLGSIERRSETPYYQQLSAALTRRIETGELPVGSRLPSENTLCSEYQVSRATVRHALQHLEAIGVVYRVANRGVFVGARRSSHGWSIQNPEGFLENAISHQNRSVTSKVIRAGYQVLPDFACAELELAEGSQGFELVRVRFLDGQPTVFSTNYLPPIVANIVEPESATLNGTGSLSVLLQRAGYSLAGANRFIRAVIPTAEIAEALQLGTQEPVLQIRSTSWRTDGRRYDVYETYVRTDVVPLEVNVRVVEGSAI